MRKVVVSRMVPYKKSLAWKYLSDIKSYPQYVTFVRKVEVPEEPKKGSEWYDTTGILWISARLKHTNIHWEEPDKIIFTVELPVSGIMTHEYSLMSIEDKTQLTCSIYFEFKNKLVDATLGPVLSKRLEYMLVSSLDMLPKFIAE